MTPSQHQPPTLKTTEDGSHTLYSNQFDQHYHNPNGAVAESKHVFFTQNGLMEALTEREQINILEIGFGTGLNLLLLLDAVLEAKNEVRVNFHTIEAFPISEKTAKSFNYGQHLNHPELAEKLPRIFAKLTKGMNRFSIIPQVQLNVFYGLFDDYQPAQTTFDFIFHDAFSPAANPDLWTGDVFIKLLHWSNPSAMLSTYCAASKAKGAMAWAGWKVAKAPGALGKREMTLASPAAEPLADFKRINEELLARRYEEGDF